MTNLELEKARLRRTDKGDRRKSVIGIGSALFALFAFVAFLNLIDSVNLAFRATQGPTERFLYWLVVRPSASSGHTDSTWQSFSGKSSRSNAGSRTSSAMSRRPGASA